MDAGLMDRCGLFLANRERMEGTFGVAVEMSCLCALVCAMENKRADVAGMEACLTMIRQNAERNSPCRDAGLIHYVAIVLSLEEEPLKVFRRAMKIYDLLVSDGFHKSGYLALAALTVARSGQDAVLFAERFGSAFRAATPPARMQDYCDIAVMAMYGVVDKPEAEHCNPRLLRAVRNKRVTRPLNRVLALTGADISVAMEMTFGASEFLIRQKGFGGLMGVGKADRTMFAAILAAQEIICRMEKGTAKQAAKAEMDALHTAICTTLAVRTYS